MLITGAQRGLIFFQPFQPIQPPYVKSSRDLATERRIEQEMRKQNLVSDASNMRIAINYYTLCILNIYKMPASPLHIIMFLFYYIFFLSFFPVKFMYTFEFSI
jgi:hypothetical protein